MKTGGGSLKNSLFYTDGGEGGKRTLTAGLWNLQHGGQEFATRVPAQVMQYSEEVYQRVMGRETRFHLPPVSLRLCGLCFAGKTASAGSVRLRILAKRVTQNEKTGGGIKEGRGPSRQVSGGCDLQRGSQDFASEKVVCRKYLGRRRLPVGALEIENFCSGGAQGGSVLLFLDSRSHWLIVIRAWCGSGPNA
ncbi:hypothetical protein TNCV_2024781 [Trichonephila clavipes]|nr:hypothetical protein TNCV_2024781 [Trichonephila clavipes]